MIKKLIFISWLLIVGILVLNIISNQNIPLGFDHGPYKHFVSLYESHNGRIAELSQRLQGQFEPFSGAFFYYLKTAVGENILFTWLYLGAHIFISVILFILAKNNGKYSLGSILGLFLFLISSIQYGNYAGALGKQIFATVFLLLNIRYQKKIFLSSIFLLACVSLHRLTGFIAILFVLFSVLHDKANFWSKKSLLLGGIIILGIITYISSFQFQILPYINSLIHNIGGNILITGRYGSGFSAKDFWFLEIPLLLITLLGFTHSCKKKHVSFLRNPYLFTFIFITFMVAFRGIAHSRLQSFLDLFLILIFIQHASFYVTKKWILIAAIIQSVLWFSIFIHDHTSHINSQEAQIIKKVVSGIPDNVYLISLSSEYRAIMTGYGHRDFRDEYSKTISITSKKERIKLSKDKKFLCNQLSQINHDVFLYRGSQEKIPSSLNNSCLTVIKKWNNGAQLMHYSKE